jgi:hypothetical protein
MPSTTYFHETVDTSMAFHPALCSAPPSTRGDLLGFKLFEPPAAYRHNEWDWMEDKVADSTVTVRCGNKNRGKSASAKIKARRLRRRRAHGGTERPPRLMAFDLKPLLQEEDQQRDEDGRLIPPSEEEMRMPKRRRGEWRRLAVGNGYVPIEWANDDYNMMHEDLKLSFGEHLRFLQFIDEYELRSFLVPYQKTALESAVWLMRENRYGLRPSLDNAYIASRRLTEDDVRGYQRGIDAALLDQATNDPYYDETLITQFRQVLEQEPILDFDLIRRGAFDVASALRSARQRYGSTLAGTRSPYDALSQDIVVNDCNFMSDDQISVVQMGLRIIRSSGKRRGDDKLKVDAEFHEENYASWQRLSYARDMFPHIKMVREDGCIIELIVQFPRDYESVGADGSEERGKALSMLSNVDNFFMSRMPRREVEWIHEHIFGMTELEKDNLSDRMGVGDFGHKPMPNHPIQFFHQLMLPSDVYYIESNAALHDRQGRRS